ncbi:zinc-binding dehydrogenase [Streptomyces sp. NPDC091281]|uniref:zinc-dependent alcohol dehydrogenase n=1 Tax=Streptomyces sp. NPDC091281 TaxID=3365985 RepID=UPI003829D8EE
MKALVITGPGRAEVQEVSPPEAGRGECVVEVHRVGLCGTDAELFAGSMPYLRSGEAAYPLRIGHEWAGVVRAVGPGTDACWLGRRVTGDTMLGCRSCALCAVGRQHLCADRHEVGIRGGRAGALAERMTVPAWSLHPLPDEVDWTQGALVEPGGNALRAVRAARPAPGQTVLVMGPGTIGVLTALLVRAGGATVHLLGKDEDDLRFARSLGFAHAWTEQTLPDERFDVVVDASNAPHLPAEALRLVQPGGTVVYVGIAGRASLIDTRSVVTADLTVAGVLSASGGLDGTITAYASGAIDPRPLVGTSVPLDQVPDVLAGRVGRTATAGPKVHVTPLS